MDTSNNLLHGLRGPAISDLRCSLYSRTVALLDPILGRSLRFLEVS